MHIRVNLRSLTGDVDAELGGAFADVAACEGILRCFSTLPWSSITEAGQGCRDGAWSEREGERIIFITHRENNETSEMTCMVSIREPHTGCIWACFVFLHAVSHLGRQNAEPVEEGVHSLRDLRLHGLCRPHLHPAELHVLHGVPELPEGHASHRRAFEQAQPGPSLGLLVRVGMCGRCARSKCMRGPAVLLLLLLRLRGCVVAQVPFQRQLGLVEPVLEGCPVPVCFFRFCVTIVRVCVCKRKRVCRKRSPMNRPCDQ